MAAATGSWAAGETAWSYYELISGRETPFPSVADVGYLGFSVLALLALLLWPSPAMQGRARWRALLDGVLVAGALFIISWVTVLGTVVQVGSNTEFALVVSLSYPLTDLLLLTMTIVVVSRAGRGFFSGIDLLGVGLLLLCLADSGFAVLSASGSYATGSWVDAGWFAGFLLIAWAALASGEVSEEDRTAGASSVESTLRTLVPFLPTVIGLTVALVGAVVHRGTGPALLASMAVLAALLLRQLLVVLDNRRLVSALMVAQQELTYQAFHDPLTGLANRALFANRLRHGLDLHQRDLRPLSLLYCDLDDFKQINDTLGHDAGDQVLRAVAERLRAATRSGDTVARMGGDEFAILVEDGGEGLTVATNILHALAQPTYVGTQTVSITGSLGLTELTDDCGPVDAVELMRRVDEAMYQAKRSTKATVVTWRDAQAAADEVEMQRS